MKNPSRNIEFEPAIFAEIDEHMWLRKTGQITVPSIDGHLLWIKSKFASLLGGIEGRDDVGRTDWSLAETLIAYSCRVRSHAKTSAEIAAADENIRLGKEAGQRSVAASMVIEGAPRGAELAARVIARKVARNKEPMTPGILKNCLKSSQRVYWEEAVRKAIAAGWLTIADGRFSVGLSQPADT